MEQGFIYVLVNSSYPGLAKVGKTTRPPAERAAELSGVTGVPTPFVLAYDQAFADCHAAERAIHAELDRRGLRVAPNREFFRGAASDIIRLILETGDMAAVPAAAVPETAAALLAAGDRALHGAGDALQDTGEAIRCFKLAAGRGSLEALERLGGIYLRLHEAAPSRATRRRAMAPLKEGARRGNACCYAEMAGLFALEGHRDNVAKAWKLFFAGQAPAADTARFAGFCRRYIDMCLHLGLAPGHLGALRLAGEDLLAALLAEMDRVRADPPGRQRAAAALRWAYTNVLAEPLAVQPCAPGVRGLRPWGLGATVAAA